jgi:hypothetical protein
MAFQTDVVFLGMDPSPSLEAFARTWAARLSRVNDRIQRCEVRIELPHRHQLNGRQFHVSVVVAVPGQDLAVTHEPGDVGAHEDAFVAVRDAFRVARRRLEEQAGIRRTVARRRRSLPA